MNLIQAVKLVRALDSAKADGTLDGKLFPRAGHITIDPLPEVQRKGLIAITVLATVSVIATLSLLLFISYRFIFWKKSYTRYIGYNQYVVLIYNLVLADLQQSLAFLICAHWVAHNRIDSPSAACFLQGLWLQIGDPSSGLFVLAIAAHTFMMVTLGRKLSHRTFVLCVVGLWVFVAMLVIIPIGSHGGIDVFTPSGAWCWIDDKYETDRLWTHYIWIFLAEFGTVTLYAIMFFQLRRRIQQSAILGNAHMDSLHRLRRVVSYMVVYPLAYLILSLPLAAGRMASARGNAPGMAYFCLSGAMMTSSGWVDVMMYTLTRKNLIVESEPSHDRSYNVFSNGHKSGGGAGNNITLITVDKKGTRSALRGRDDDDSSHARDGSTDNIVPRGQDMGKVYQETTIEVTSEPAYPDDHSGRSSRDDLPDEPRVPPRTATSNRMW
ncbi:conserved hypothetical protein [Paecilomyces variotii No. 5]|uniref:G protein-coupled receptor GPR1/2/3 C-terminal domain-containing protein n=1 Tax=Byssochlamys spectabilis (strain No. 5 / NBRC 109023) TaxID=1356009 RepID=V5FXY3_BYSSN|nr:conserved hypothetical protein [Paecilomyces variotii No. 5]